MGSPSHWPDGIGHLATFAVTVALGLRYLGVLLIGSLKYLATTLNSMLAIAVGVR